MSDLIVFLQKLVSLTETGDWYGSKFSEASRDVANLENLDDQNFKMMETGKILATLTMIPTFLTVPDLKLDEADLRQMNTDAKMYIRQFADKIKNMCGGGRRDFGGGRRDFGGGRGGFMLDADDDVWNF